MSKYIVDIHGEIDGDYEIIGKYEEPRWIKCSDNLPDIAVDVLGTTKDNGDVVKVTRWKTYVGDADWEWLLTDDIEGNSYHPDEIIAWMPLPEGYKENKDDKTIAQITTQIARAMNVSEVDVRTSIDKLINPPQPYVPLQGICKSPCATCGVSHKASCCGCEEYFEWEEKSNDYS